MNASFARRVRYGLTVGLVLLIGGGFFVWWQSRAIEVDVMDVKAQALVRSLQFSARVSTLSRVDVGSTLTGRVAQVLVNEGAQVARGDVLVRLDTEELAAVVTQAVAAERQAQARLEGLRTSGRQLAGAVLAQAEANLRAAMAEYQRAQELVAKGFLSASRVDEARRAVDVARAQQASAQAQAQANAEAGTDIRQASAQIDLARAATLAARARLAQAVIAAPADAQVLSRAVEPGQIVQPGRALMNLALDGPAQLTAQVDERFLEQLQVGQAASVIADAFAGKRFSARVLSIAPAIDPQRGVVEVKFSLAPAVPAFLREDMTVSVEVETARRERAIVLPLTAVRLRSAGGTATVWLVEQERLTARVVKLGLETLDAVEVLEGLQPGDQVMVTGKATVDDRVNGRVVAWQPVQSGALSSAQGGDAASALSNAMGR
jgi:HlyD family secretion protein